MLQPVCRLAYSLTVMSLFPDQLECLPGAVADVTACTEAVLKPDFAAFRALGLALLSGLGTFSVAFVALLATRLCHRPRCKPSAESAALSADLCGGLQGEDMPFPEAWCRALIRHAIQLLKIVF